jgi:lysophospholipase L1-like esterase
MTRYRPGVRVLLMIVAAVVAAGVVVPTAGAAPGVYVAVGDSYTAGPGVLLQQLDPLGCFRSNQNYPSLLAARRGLALRDRSCSGAVTSDLTSPQAILGGANPPQLDALDAGVTLLSVQIGGNDIGFTEILQRCVAVLPLGAPCRAAYTGGGVDQISQRITATAPKVAAVLAEARRRAPQARILVLGYPAILPETTQPSCWPLLPIAPDDVPYLRDKEKELNAMLASQAAVAGATYVDVYTPSIGRDACQFPGVRWVEPLVPLSPAAPVHPNALGMQGMAAILEGAMAA